ncbi:MAG TPA: hypothetical protein PLK35_00760 [Candidatus Moranbacteria bacterium]|nr:hypothetical protein [Candidatus Moranbacteria bacterium]
MIDSIGLGKSIANIIYAVIFIVGLGGCWVFVKRKNIIGIIFCISFTLNLFLYLYLIGNYNLYLKIIYLIINKYWPILNIILFLILIINYLKIKINN